ncbi:sensor histidine kinase [Herbidospora daliensis]|uniref:sensor histidine kinase n=1 Tax=Herbidospora daliensis TaxID=295585 RepID=UPI000782B1F7|nr:histidine kinase [Herbidospora daliensis]
MRDHGLDGETAALRRYTRWSLAGSSAFFLVSVVGAGLLASGVPVWARGAGGVALVVTAGCCVVLLNHRLASDPAPPVAWTAVSAAGTATLAGVLLAVRDDALWALAPAMTVSIAATFLPSPRRWALIAVAMAAAAVPGALAGGDDPVRAVLFPPGLVAFSAWVTLGSLWAWDIAERLNAARRLDGELAVTRERLRFAADLHDIQGHHLQVIARKSELAARLAAADPARATAEMLEVQRLATDALSDTRAVVQGYRRTTLDAELANAGRVLAAADIRVQMNVEPAPLPDADRHLLGLVVREATTNVLRHSRASAAEVDYRLTDGLARLRVRNDGTTGPPGAGSGTGLRTLADRLRAAGGELTWEHDHGSFVVTACLPVGAGAEAR